MCGIVGYWRLDGLEDQAEAQLSAMMDLLAHRGPDGRGRHVDRPRGLAMGHTRLAIVDLSGGQQPLYSPDQALVLTANGELYDQDQTLRSELSGQGYRFATRSDAELALALYRVHGLDFVDHLRGEFAFALYDRDRDRLVLVRDRFGIKPLYIHHTRGAIYWASEIKALLRHPAIPRRLDAAATLHQMMQVMVPGTTAFEAIEAVQPGHMLVFRRRGARLDREERRYWDLDFPRAAERAGHGGAREWISGVRDRLVDAVRVRLEADVPVGCYLSGGVDSCTILGVAAAQGHVHPINAYTIGFDNAAFDESEAAATMARAVGARHHVMRLDASRLYGDYFSRTLWHSERTFYNTLAVAKWHMSRVVVESGHKAVLTGEGSDELFGGYSHFKKDLYLHASADGDPRSDYAASLAQMRARYGPYATSIAAEERAQHPAWIELMGFTPSWIQPWLLTLDVARPLLSPRLREQLAGYDPVAAIAAQIDPTQIEGRHVLDRAQYSWIKTMLEGQILSWGGDRVDMANSMESRPAFLDHHVAEFARMVPPDYRIRGGVEKWVLREAARPFLPTQLQGREKFAFLAPPSATDSHKHKAVNALIERHASPAALHEAGLFDPDRVGELVARSRAGDPRAQTMRHDVLINHILGLQILHEEFVAKIPEVPPPPGLGLVFGSPPAQARATSRRAPG